MLEFVESDLYFVQDKNNFINTVLQVGPLKKVPDPTGYGSSSMLYRFSNRVVKCV